MIEYCSLLVVLTFGFYEVFLNFLFFNFLNPFFEIDFFLEQDCALSLNGRWQGNENSTLIILTTFFFSHSVLS